MVLRESGSSEYFKQRVLGHARSICRYGKGVEVVLFEQFLPSLTTLAWLSWSGRNRGRGTKRDFECDSGTKDQMREMYKSKVSSTSRFRDARLPSANHRSAPPCSPIKPKAC